MNYVVLKDTVDGGSEVMSHSAEERRIVKMSTIPFTFITLI